MKPQVVHGIEGLDLIYRVAMFAFAIILAFQTPAFAENPVGVSASWVRTAMDNEGNIHLVYANDYSGSYYMKFNGSSWIGPTYLPNSANNWFPFTMPDIAVGPDGRPHAVYGIKTGEYPNDLDVICYARANDTNGTSWNVQTIGNDGYRRNHARIAVDENNVQHITYMKTNKSEPFWWQIIYRRPDGSEKIIDTGVDWNRVNNPDIDCRNGIVHIAYYKGGSGSMTTNIRHAWDVPYGEFPIEQITNMSYNWFAGTPTIAVDSNGAYHIAYLVANWGNEPPYYMGVHVNGDVVDAGTAPIDEEHEDWAPVIDFTPSGDRYIVWSYHTRGECYYKRNWDGKEILTPYGHMSLCTGPGGAYYVRTTGNPGPMYYDQIGGGAPPNQLPVAIFSVSPESGDFEQEFQFDASASYDPDGDTPLSYSWDWESDGDFDVWNSSSPTIAHVLGYPGTYQVTLRVEDTRGGTGTTSQDVSVTNYPPTAVFAYSQTEENTVHFDATASSDPEDDTSLMYRWDWDDDGEFEGWTIFPTAAYEFPEPGSYPVTLEVKDLLAAVDDTMIVVDVEGTPPSPPDSLTAVDYPEDQGYAVLVTWVPSPDDTLREGIVEYLMRRISAEDSSFVDVTIPAGESTYVDSVPALEPFFYRIAAFDGYTYSDWIDAPDTAMAIDNTPPEPATDLEAEIIPLEEGWAVLLDWEPSPSEDLVQKTVLRRVDDEEEWTELDTLPPPVSEYADTIEMPESYLYSIRTNDGSNVNYSDSIEVEIVGVDENAALPLALSLHSVDPNPVYGEAIIRFGVPAPGIMTMTIHDLTGRRVGRKGIVCREAGWHTMRWNVRSGKSGSLPGGTYVLKLALDGQTASTPVVVLP